MERIAKYQNVQKKFSTKNFMSDTHSSMYRKMSRSPTRVQEEDNSNPSSVRQSQTLDKSRSPQRVNTFFTSKYESNRERKNSRKAFENSVENLMSDKAASPKRMASPKNESNLKFRTKQTYLKKIFNRGGRGAKEQAGNITTTKSSAYLTPVVKKIDLTKQSQKQIGLNEGSSKSRFSNLFAGAKNQSQLEGQSADDRSKVNEFQLGKSNEMIFSSPMRGSRADESEKDDEMAFSPVAISNTPISYMQFQK